MSGVATDFTLNHHPAVANAKDMQKPANLQSRRQSTDSSFSKFSKFSTSSSISALKAMAQRYKPQKSSLLPKKEKKIPKPFKNTENKATTMEARAAYFAMIKP